MAIGRLVALTSAATAPTNTEAFTCAEVLDRARPPYVLTIIRLREN
jgi:hypothetical protein